MSQFELLRELGRQGERLARLEERVETIEEAKSVRPPPSDEKKLLGFLGSRELVIIAVSLAILGGAGAAVVLVIFGNAKTIGDLIELVKVLRGEG